VNRELDHAWQRIDAELRRAVTDSTYAIWLEPLRLVELSAESLVVAAPDNLRSWVADRYGPLLERVAQLVLDEPVRVRFVGPDATPDPGRPAATVQIEHPAPLPPGSRPDQPFNPKLTFDQFVIGDSNRFAHAAALAVAEMPGQAYNPLYICGKPGLGKTHLLHAIANYVTRFGGGLTVRYATVETFTNEFVAALQQGSVERFKARFRHNDVLLIDDVQFLAAKVRTEEEFFHTFNALYDTGSQLVFTSDRPPLNLPSVEERLRERFGSGLVCEIKPPDTATRLTILRKRAVHDGIAPADSNALTVVAERIDDNVRALEGALIRIVAFASLTGRPVTSDLAAEVLDGLYGARRPVRRTVEDVQAAACEAFDITREELVSPSRTARLTWPRQVAMYLARELTDQTLPAIGRAFGGRDHTTVMHACKRTAARMAGDPDAFEAVRALTERLRADR
jgi:chromosomal replication initiator protein